MEEYQQVVMGLFALLEVANEADSDSARSWQRSHDASNRHGFYAHIRRAISEIAGDEILEHWAATGEIDILLASR